MRGQVDQLRVRPVLAIRWTEASPRWEDPLSTIQNTRFALAYLAAWDVRRGRVMGRCEDTTGIAPPRS